MEQNSCSAKTLLDWARKYCTGKGKVTIKSFYDLNRGGYRLEMYSKNYKWVYHFGLVFPTEINTKLRVQDACLAYFN